MKTHRQRAAAAIVGAFLASGLTSCSTGGLAQIRPERLYERHPAKPAAYDTIGTLDVTRRSFQLFGIPVSIPNIVAAVDSKVQTANADAVTNVLVEARPRSIFFLATWTEYRVTGDFIRFRESAHHD